MPLKQLFLRKKTIADKTQKQKYSFIQIVDIIEKEKFGAIFLNSIFSKCML